MLLLILIKVTTKNILTAYGEEEIKKILQLKNYIKEYSLMKERELSSVIIWDKYLAYSIAFGISSKVTQRLYSEWLTTNIVLQTIDEILKLF